MDEIAVREPQTLLLENRSRLCLTGVTDVDSFDETTVVAATGLGALTVSGADLKISTLNTETGELLIQGEINALIYTEQPQKSGGFFSRVFR